jgi:hypothetical protein
MSQSYLEQLKKDVAFDQYSRYETFRRIIEDNRDKVENKKIRVLDVGGRGNLMIKFMPADSVFYLDPFIESDDENFIVGDGCDLPLEDNSFDWLVSADVYEHIPQDKRLDFLKEQVRVAKYGVILSAPFKNDAVNEVEHKVNDLFKIASEGVDHPWLIEHFENGLPTEDFVESFIKDHNLEFQKIFNNNLEIWFELMNIVNHVGEMTYDSSMNNGAEINEFYANTIYLNDTLSKDHNSYRKIYYIKKDSSISNLQLKDKFENETIVKVKSIAHDFTTRLALNYKKDLHQLRVAKEALQFEYETYQFHKNNELKQLADYRDLLEAKLKQFQIPGIRTVVRANNARKKVIKKLKKNS